MVCYFLAERIVFRNIISSEMKSEYDDIYA